MCIIISFRNVFFNHNLSFDFVLSRYLRLLFLVFTCESVFISDIRLFKHLQLVIL